MSAVGLATLGVQCGNNRALGMASLGVFCRLPEVIEVVRATSGEFVVSYKTRTQVLRDENDLIDITQILIASGLLDR